MTTFTMAEFIKEHKLKVDILDSGATRIIAQSLKQRGFEKTRMRWGGKVQVVWTNERGKRISALQAKLADIKF